MNVLKSLTNTHVKPWRLILSGHHDAYTNMAFDEALLEGYLRCNALPTFRIYGWKPAAISLGYFQDPVVNLRLDECCRQQIPLVRRLTGGGVLIHDNDLSYSVVCSAADIGCDTSVTESFKKTCSFLQRAYAVFRLNARFACEVSPVTVRHVPASAIRPDFCLASNEKYDLLINGKKLGGNAQKRRKHAFLQHGSIPLQDVTLQAQTLLRQRDVLSDTFSWLGDLAAKKVTFDELQYILIDSFCQSFGATVVQGNLTEEEERIFQDLRDAKYATQEWNYAKSGRKPSTRLP
ncbi:MAG TPA: lipoate--protein ligase family protein [Candidatus Omnitrophota bacterium]|nr:lipoate--protein ligase family protein [Candidatus Omnitrophota bacterium]HPT07135.1 lipoate--protein ligase family protein [Candidatus Omnitrophota bacterium]